ncbi:MAG: hypothetical protein SNH27_17120, partial [Rikenellaceae bacterium]
MQGNDFPKFNRLRKVVTTNIDRRKNLRDADYYTKKAAANRDRNTLLMSEYGENEKLKSALVSDRKGRDGEPLMGMDGLYHILCDMRRDIKKVSDAQSLNGAQKWATKRGDGYTAEETDLNADDITEVVVFDPYGNPVMINGYTTKDSQWATNHAYFTENDTKDKRKAKSKKDFMNEQFHVQYEDAEHPGVVTYTTPEWVKKAVANNYNISKPRDKSPYQLFTSEVVKRLFDHAKTILKANNKLEHLNFLNPGFLKLAAHMWKWSVLRPAIVKLWEDDGDDIFKAVESRSEERGGEIVLSNPDPSDTVKEM